MSDSEEPKWVLVASPATADQETTSPRAEGPRFDLNIGMWVAVALGAVAFYLVTVDSTLHLGATVATFLVVAGLLVGGRVRSASSLAALGLAGTLAVFLALRDNTTLSVANVLSIYGLLWLSVAFAKGASLLDATPLGLLVRGVRVLTNGLAAAVEGPAVVAGRSARVAGHQLSKRRRAAATQADPDTGSRFASAATIGAVLRGLLIAGPIVLVIGVLLASGDAVFAEAIGSALGAIGDLLLLPDISLNPFDHVIPLAIGAYLMTVGLRCAGRDLGAGWAPSFSPKLSRIELLMVLGGLVLVYGLYALIRVQALLTNDINDVVAAAEWARGGFFELLWAAALTVLVVTAAEVLTRRLTDGTGTVRALAVAVIVLTQVVVATAHQRLAVYIATGGQTELRLYATAFTLWIAVVFALVAIRILGLARSRTWLTTAVGLSAVLFLLVLNVVNPERMIVETNLAQGGAVLVEDFHRYSADGQVAILERLDETPEPFRTELTERFCSRRVDSMLSDEDSAWTAYLRAEVRRDALRNELCADGS
jgi:hypothetical protein